MHVLVLDSINQALDLAFEEVGWTVENLSSSDEYRSKLPSADGIVLRSRFKVDRSFIDAHPNLKFVGRSGAGLENIDTEYLDSREIPWFNSPEGNRDSVGEHTLGLLLSLSHKIAQANATIQDGIWSRSAHWGIEIKGKTIGILGYGQMGSSFAEKCAGLGAKVIANDKFKSGFGSNLVKEVTLDELRSEADVLSIHINYLPENKNLIDRSFLESFSKPVLILNTARGDVLDIDGLVALLKNGKVIGAGIDVLDLEGSSFEKINWESRALSFLRSAPNVLLTPHVAGWSYESDERMATVLANKIIRHFSA